jgi:hypothetical protein
MERSRQDRGPDTNMLEIKKIVDCLVRNGYEFTGTREAVYGRNRYEDDAIADFSKKLDYNAADGDYKNDSEIKVSIHFEKRADFENFKKNEDEDDIYVGDPDVFIMGLVEENQGSARGTTQKNRKPRRNRRKSSNRYRK